MKDEVDIAREVIRRNEGVRRKPYEDTEGNITIGVGRNLDDVGLSDAEIEYLYSNDLDAAVRAAKTLTYYNDLNTARKVALIDMAFNLGLGGLQGFQRMHARMAEANWPAAATEVLDSLYARQVPNRARRVAMMIRTGEVEE